MDLPRVVAFTDTYLPTVNGVTYTVETWRDRWAARGGHMDVVYPDGDHDPAANEYPVNSVPFPFYDGRGGVGRDLSGGNDVCAGGRREFNIQGIRLWIVVKFHYDFPLKLRSGKALCIVSPSASVTTRRYLPSSSIKIQ
jgi:hypothetical protein